MSEHMDEQVIIELTELIEEGSLPGKSAAATSLGARDATAARKATGEDTPVTSSAGSMDGSGTTGAVQPPNAANTAETGHNEAAESETRASAGTGTPDTDVATAPAPDAGASAGTFALSPLVVRMVPGLVDRVGGLGDTLAALADKVEQQRTRLNSIEDAMRHFRLPGEEADELAARLDKAVSVFGERLEELRQDCSDKLEQSGNLVQESLQGTRVLEERLASLEKHLLDQNSGNAPLPTVINMRLAECEEQMARLATREEMANTRAELRSIMDGVHAETEQTRQSWEELFGDLGRRLDGLEHRCAELEARETPAGGQSVSQEALSALETRLSASLQERTAALEAHCSHAQQLDGELHAVQNRIGEVADACDQLAPLVQVLAEEDGKRKTILQQLADNQARQEQAAAALEEKIADMETRQEQQRLAMQEQIAAVQARQDEEAGSFAGKLSNVGQKHDETAREVQERLSGLEAVHRELSRRVQEAVETASSDLVARMDALADRLQALEESRQETVRQTENLARRMDSLEGLLSEDAIENAAAKACVRVLREEIARLVGKGS